MSRTLRFLLIGTFGVFSLLLLDSGREWIAALSFGLAVYFLGIDAVLPILGLIFAALSCVLFTIILWLPRFASGIGFSEYLQENWLFPASLLGVSIWAIWRYLSDAEETWKILLTDYATDLEQTELASEYCASGYLLYEDEGIPVEIFLLGSGLLLIRPSESARHLPWERIERIRVAEGENAIVALKRQSMVPFEISVPWIPEFDEHVPTGLLV